MPDALASGTLRPPFSAAARRRLDSGSGRDEAERGRPNPPCAGMFGARGASLCPPGAAAAFARGPRDV